MTSPGPASAATRLLTATGGHPAPSVEAGSQRAQGGAVGSRQAERGAVGSRQAETIHRLPVPPGPPGEDPLVLPASVSCASATACVTVGSNQTAAMAERWNGTTWTVQRTPDPA